MSGQGLFFKSYKFVINGRGLLNNRITNVNFQFPVMGLKQDTRDKLKHLNIPEKPKRPLVPYLRFISDQRPEILKNNPNIKLTDVVKKCAEKWNNISVDEKLKYTKSFEKEREQYEIKFLRYKESLSAEQVEAIKDLEQEKKHDREKRRIRKLYRETNKPKRPAGPYMQYLKEQSSLQNKNLKDLMSTEKETWSKLSKSELQKYHDMFIKDKKRYETAMAEWETKMAKEGRTDLIRVKTLELEKEKNLKLNP